MADKAGAGGCSAGGGRGVQVGIDQSTRGLRRKGALEGAL